MTDQSAISRCAQPRSQLAQKSEGGVKNFFIKEQASTFPAIGGTGRGEALSLSIAGEKGRKKAARRGREKLAAAIKISI